MYVKQESTTWSEGHPQTTSRAEYGKKPKPISINRRPQREKKASGTKDSWNRRHTTGDILVSNYDTSGFKYEAGPLAARVRVEQGDHNRWWSKVLQDGLIPPPEEDEILRLIQRSKLGLPSDVEISGDQVTRALAASKEAELDLLTTLAEMPETVSMLADVIKSVRNPLKAVARHRKALRKSKTHIVDTATESWLMYRYGVMPLYLTSQDLMSTLTERFREYKSTRDRENTVQAIYREDRNFGFGAFGASMDVILRGEYLVEARTVKRVFIKNCYDLDALTRTHWGLNPALTAWEMVPLSFVVDWFIQVGDFIQAVSPGFHSKRGATMSFQNEIRVRYDPKELSYVGRPVEAAKYHWVVPTYGAVDLEASLYDYKRVVIHPESHLTLPAEFGINLKRAADSLSLSWPVIKREFLALSSKKGARNGKI